MVISKYVSTGTQIDISYTAKLDVYRMEKNVHQFPLL